MSLEIIRNGISQLPLKEAKNYSEELVFWNRISDLLEDDEFDFLAVGKISSYNKLKRWTGMFLLTNKNIFIIPENKNIEITKIEISIIEKFVIKKGLLNKVNINEYGFNFQKNEDEKFAIKRMDEITNVRIKRENFIPLWIYACYFINITLYDDQKIIFVMGYLFIPIYLSKETYLIEFEKGNNLFICLLKAILYGFVLLIIGTIFLKG